MFNEFHLFINTDLLSLPHCPGRQIIPLNILQDHSNSLKDIAATKPIRVLNPTTLALPVCTASGIMAAAIMVSMAPAAKPSANINHV